MKVIFLDIDGVLNHWTNTRRLRGMGLPFRDDDGMLFCPDSVKQLERIAKETGAVVVISSSWRESGLPEMVRLFYSRGVNVDIHDITPKLNGSRGAQIEAWLAKNRNVSKYVIIDDDSRVLKKQKRRFVRTTLEFGLTKELANEAIKILK